MLLGAGVTLAVERTRHRVDDVRLETRRAQIVETLVLVDADLGLDVGDALERDDETDRLVRKAENRSETARRCTLVNHTRSMS